MQTSGFEERGSKTNNYFLYFDASPQFFTELRHFACVSRELLTGPFQTLSCNIIATPDILRKQILAQYKLLRSSGSVSPCHDTTTIMFDSWYNDLNVEYT